MSALTPSAESISLLHPLRIQLVDLSEIFHPDSSDRSWIVLLMTMGYPLSRHSTSVLVSMALLADSVVVSLYYSYSHSSAVVAASFDSLLSCTVTPDPASPTSTMTTIAWMARFAYWIHCWNGFLVPRPVVEAVVAVAEAAAEVVVEGPTMMVPLVSVVFSEVAEVVVEFHSTTRPSPSEAVPAAAVESHSEVEQ